MRGMRAWLLPAAGEFGLGTCRDRGHHDPNKPLPHLCKELGSTVKPTLARPSSITLVLWPLCSAGCKLGEGKRKETREAGITENRFRIPGSPETFVS